MPPTRVCYLEMDAPERLRPARDPGPEVAVALAGVPLGAINRFFYVEIGRDHHWVDRLEWTPAQWQAWAERPGLETWIVHLEGTPAGYCELVAGAHAAIDIVFFGILPGLQGRGLGGWLLTVAVRRAWERGARRVRLNTCELDAPHALANYRARGFEVVRERVEDRGRRN
jgi:GNAT superfamily N-acetyltransferase